jgi:hypothetical protein
LFGGSRVARPTPVISAFYRSIFDMDAGCSSCVG